MTARRKYLTGSLAVLMIVGAAGFAGWQLAIWPLNQHSEIALARRAQRFWDLKLSGDTRGAYDYMIESYRRRVSEAGFAREGVGLVVHTGAKVLSTRLVADDTGEVQLELKYIVNKEHFNKAEVNSVVTERWVFEDGSWYRWPVG